MGNKLSKNITKDCPKDSSNTFRVPNITEFLSDPINEGKSVQESATAYKKYITEYYKEKGLDILEVFKNLPKKQIPKPCPEQPCKECEELWGE